MIEADFNGQTNHNTFCWIQYPTITAFVLKFPINFPITNLLISMLFIPLLLILTFCEVICLKWWFWEEKPRLFFKRQAKKTRTKKGITRCEGTNFVFRKHLTNPNWKIALLRHHHSLRVQIKCPSIYSRLRISGIADWPSIWISLNFLLFWLVWAKTPTEMWVHSRILLQTCCVDLIFLCVCLVTSPLLISQGSTLIVLLDGYLIRAFASIFNYDPCYLTILNIVTGMCVYFDVYSISVQFVYRYLVLTRDIQISLGRYLLMLTLPFIASSIVAAFYAFQFGETTGVLVNEAKTALNRYIDWDNSIYIIKPNVDNYWMFASLLMIVIFYTINTFYGVKLVKFVRAQAVNAGTKELNQQLTQTLIILALAKLFIVTQYSAVLGANWMPTVNPIVSIWIYKPYWHAAKKLISSIFKNDNSITPVEPLS